MQVQHFYYQSNRRYGVQVSIGVMIVCAMDVIVEGSR